MTPAERDCKRLMVEAARKASASCRKCRHLHRDYRSAAGHLALDPTTGATVLEPHETR